MRFLIAQECNRRRGLDTNIHHIIKGIVLLHIFPLIPSGLSLVFGVLLRPPIDVAEGSLVLSVCFLFLVLAIAAPFLLAKQQGMVLN